MANVATRVSQDTDTADPCEGEELYEDEVPNATTIAALEEVERILHDPTAKRYTDIEEALAALKA